MINILFFIAGLAIMILPVWVEVVPFLKVLTTLIMVIGHLMFWGMLADNVKMRGQINRLKKRI